MPRILGLRPYPVVENGPMAIITASQTPSWQTTAPDLSLTLADCPEAPVNEAHLP